MICKQPCFDCPFLKTADRLHLDPSISEEFTYDHFTEDGGFQEIICEEQEGVCFGQVQVLANSYHFGLDIFSDLGEAVEDTPIDTKDYFRGPWEYRQYHDG